MDGPGSQSASGPKVTPSSLSLASPPSRAVSTHGPCGVRVKVCSVCGRGQAVVGDDRPVVLERVVLLLAQREHRLDRERQTLDQLRALAGLAVVRHVRRLVHRRPDPVPDEVLDDPVRRVGAHVRLDRGRDVGQPATELGGGEPTPHRLLADPGQLEQFVGATCADRHRDRRVAVPAVDDRTAVDRDQVALGQHPVARDAVHDLVVHRGADRAGEAVVALERRLSHRRTGWRPRRSRRAHRY